MIDAGIDERGRAGYLGDANVVLRRFEIGDDQWTCEQVGETPGTPLVAEVMATVMAPELGPSSWLVSRA